MALNRLNFFEREAARCAPSITNVAQLLTAAQNWLKMIGEEFDWIEKNTTSQASPAPASGGTVIINGTTVVTGGPPATGVIAIIRQDVVAGANTITFSSPLSSLIYGGFLILADSSGMLIDNAELRMRATLMSKTSFVYMAPVAGSLYGFAVVAT